mgnify:CR=1 FL=1
MRGRIGWLLALLLGAPGCGAPPTPTPVAPLSRSTTQPTPSGDAGVPAPPPTGFLRVETDPPGAMISLDGTPLGISPVEAPVPAGRHVLDFAFGPGRFPQRRVTVEPGERRALHVPLREQRIDPQAAAQQREATHVGAQLEALRPALLQCLRTWYGRRPGRYHWVVRVDVEDGQGSLTVLEPSTAETSIRLCMTRRVEAMDVWETFRSYTQQHDLTYDVR